MNTATTHKVKLCVNLECSNVVDIPSLDVPGFCLSCANELRKRLAQQQKVIEDQQLKRDETIKERNRVTTLIKMLRDKRTAALKTKRGATIEHCAHVENICAQFISVCERLAFNFNVKYKGHTELQRSQASLALQRVILKAEHLIVDERIPS